VGLGLAISQQLVALMNGQIGVESQEGGGSTFWFTARLARAVSPRFTDEPGVLDGLRILVIDRNPTSRRALERTLSAAGCAARCTAGTAEAEALLSEAARRGDRFDAVLLDVSLPGLPRESGAVPPIIALRSIRRETAAPAQDEYAAALRRPIKQAALLEVIASVVRTHRAVPTTAA
jgi:CheY-like chemotaxis protein